MNQGCLQREPLVSDAELHRFVADSLDTYSGNSRRVDRIERRLFVYRSSFAIDEVTAWFDHGASLPLIFKNLSTNGLLEHARELRPGLGYDHAREVVTYRDILAPLNLDTAVCYAAVADEPSHRYWLLLEKIAGIDLARAGSIEAWSAAARWLAMAHGRLSAVVQERELSDALFRYDIRCFHQWINQAERTLQRPQLANGGATSPREIRWLLEQCRAAARRVAALPSTVIHGEFYPSNILVDERGTQPRICPVDWETTGIGPGLLDVAALVAGGWAEKQKEAIANAYLTAHEELRGSPTDVVSQLKALRCCRLLLAMKWVGWSASWQPPPEHRYDWLGEAVELARELGADLAAYGSSHRGVANS